MSKIDIVRIVSLKDERLRNDEILQGVNNSNDHRFDMQIREMELFAFILFH